MKTPENLKIKDLAKRLDISKTSVYRYLKDPGTNRVSQATKRRIDVALGDEEFRLNVNAQSLSVGKSNVIAVLIPLNIPYFSNPVISEILDGIQSVFPIHNYKLTFIPTKATEMTEGSTGFVREQISMAFGYDGCILFGTRHCSWVNMRRNVEHMLVSRMPFVVVNMPRLDYKINQVVNVTPKSTSATRLLLSLGHKRILFLGGNKEVPNMDIPLKEYRESYEDFGLSPDDSLIKDGGYDRGRSRDVVLSSLEEGLDFSAIYCLTDIMALGAYEALAERNVRIPKDISVIGRGDTAMTVAMRPRLTTVHIPFKETGRIAAGLLLDAIKGTAPPRCIELENELILRESIQPYVK